MAKTCQVFHAQTAYGYGNTPSPAFQGWGTLRSSVWHQSSWGFFVSGQSHYFLLMVQSSLERFQSEAVATKHCIVLHFHREKPALDPSVCVPHISQSQRESEKSFLKPRDFLGTKRWNDCLVKMDRQHKLWYIGLPDNQHCSAGHQQEFLTL